MFDYNQIEELFSSDNTKKIKYIILFFITILALSHNMFSNIFGCNIKMLLNTSYTRHIIVLLFLYLLMDLNINDSSTYVNPLLTLVYSVLVYLLAMLLMHSNQIYIIFIISIIVLLLVLDKFKKYFENTINDQEILQTKLGIIYKTNNVFVVIMILTIIIGSMTSLNSKTLRHFFLDNIKSCDKSLKK
jgi:hypothetical protein